MRAASARNLASDFSYTVVSNENESDASCSGYSAERPAIRRSSHSVLLSIVTLLNVLVYWLVPAPYDPGDVERLITSLDEAQELIRDLCAKNEVLVSQLEQLPRMHRAQIEALQESTNAAIQRAADAQQQVQEVVNSRIWRALVRISSIALRLTGGPRH